MQRPGWEQAKPWVMQIALFATMAIVGWYAIRPVTLSIHGKMDEIQKLGVMREHRTKQLQRLPELEKQHALIAANESKMRIVLSKEELVTFIETLERLAQEGGVTIELASQDNTFLESKITVVEKKTTKKPVASEDEDAAPSPRRDKKESGLISELPLKNFLKLTITVQGTYPSIVNYLHKLETLPYALDVVAIHMVETEESGDAPAPESGALNPFVEGSATLPAAPLPTPQSSGTILDADFETVIYMNNL